MSYSVNFPCFHCLKKMKCIDESVVNYSVFALHEIGPNKGHLGSGSINVSCGNFASDEEEKPKNNIQP